MTKSNPYQKKTRTSFSGFTCGARFASKNCLLLFITCSFLLTMYTMVYTSLIMQSSVLGRYDMLNMVDHREDRPKLILHIGPHKTGSTSIQCTLTHYQNILMKDSYFYIGKKPAEARCPGVKLNENAVDHDLSVAFGISMNKLSKKKRLSKFVDKFSASLDYHFDKRENVIVSIEEFANMSDNGSWQLLFNDLKRWDVRVVLTYRHYFEWLLSAYNSMHKPLPRRKDTMKWPNGQNQGGAHIPTFAAYFDKVLQGDDSVYRDGVYFRESRPIVDTFVAPGRAVREAKKHFSNVVMLDMKDGDVVESFVCHIPGADHSCNEIRQNQKLFDVANPSVPLHFDMLATAAYDMGLVDKSDGALTREKVRNELMLSLASETDFPLQCLSKEQELTLLKMSLRDEKAVGLFSAQGSSASDHEKAFQNAKERKRFCSVDTAVFLGDEKWRELFIHRFVKKSE